MDLDFTGSIFEAATIPNSTHLIVFKLFELRYACRAQNDWQFFTRRGEVTKKNCSL